ncbi:ParB/RepB/Spo0J family partition protein [Deinococcus hohokamensis]|uniref:ParB/RepB/Spo0J family partition protein n=1 Tax=Deinococcus hohokamensis TaxID=309883 RepID=A0ABV9IEA7_9DEIO
MTRRKRPERPDLGGLLGESARLLADTPSTPPQSCKVEMLRPGLGQPRRTFHDASLSSLAQSIRVHGVLQPLLVRPVEEGFEIVAGERRWRAAQLAGLPEVPVLIREITDQEARIAALTENLQRENLNVIDEVDAKLDLAAATLGLERDEARSRLIRLTKEPAGAEAAALEAAFAPVGESWASFAKNKLRVLGWPAAVVDALRAGLPLTLASIIAAAPPAHHASLIKQARQGASRSELRAEADRLSAPAKQDQAPAAEQVARRLASRRFMAGLSAQERQAVERWLAKMPEVLKG